jgi:hypothetical protein
MPDPEMLKGMLGKPVAGRMIGDTAGGGACSWRTAPIKQLAFMGGLWPQVAAVRALGVGFDPFVQSINATFTNAMDSIGPFPLGNNAEGRLSMVSIVDRIVLHIDAPNLNAGNALQPFIAWFFTRQSGITANLVVDGSPRYVVAPDYQPLDTLLDMIAEAWPMGWLLGYTQMPKMQFVTSFALPSVPVNIYCTFRMWQPQATSQTMGMTNLSAINILQQTGYLTADECSQLPNC